MNFVIFDLEWNNAYNYKAQTGMNEIIEIGAVMLDGTAANCRLLLKQLILAQGI